MQKIRASLVKPGNVLVKPIRNSQGLIIVNKGTVLTAELIEKISAWDIADIYIEGFSTSGTELRETSEQYLDVDRQTEDLINHKFAFVEHTVFVETIMNALKVHLSSKDKDEGT